MKVMFLDTSLAPVGFNIPQQQVLQSRNPWKFMWSICLHQCSLLCPVAGTQPDKQKARFCASQLCFFAEKKTSWRLASLHPEPLVSKIWKWQNDGSVLQRREAAQGTLKSSGQWSTSMPKSTWQKFASKTPSFQKKRITRGKKKTHGAKVANDCRIFHQNKWDRGIYNISSSHQVSPRVGWKVHPFGKVR